LPGTKRLRHVVAPELFDGDGLVVFLAGGITGCPDWQQAAVSLLAEVDATAMNPRRPGRIADAPDIAAEQVAWECRYLSRADVVLFWFPPGPAVQPIALYELGKIAAGTKPIAVGADPGYRRRLDVVLQLSHARPDVPVLPTLTATAEQVKRLLPGAHGSGL
jgi:Nucleoside 2-deoxyribosyltransferase like